MVSCILVHGRSLTLLFHRTLNEIRAAIPAHLFVRHTWKGLLYLARDLLIAAAFWDLALRIDPYYQSSPVKARLTPIGAEVGRWAFWLV